MKFLIFISLALAMALSSISAADQALQCSDFFSGKTLSEMLKERGLYQMPAALLAPHMIQNFLNRERTRAEIPLNELVPDYDLINVSFSYEESGGEFIALVDASGELVGTAALFPTGQTTAEIRKFYLAPALAGSGLGRKIFAHLVALAEARGYSTLRVETFSHLTQALRLYDQFDFKLTKETVPGEPHTIVYRRDSIRP